jgi:pSer/pThr/pTyr-binding forkhead associated (FHA) protein
MGVDDTVVAPDAAASTQGVAAVAGAAAGGQLAPGRVKLTVEQGMTIGKQFVLGDNEMQVGREDDEEGIYPDIDLSDQDEGYVHRKHATLKFENGGLTLTHLGGANKTRINNRPLPDNEAQPVNIGDKVAFGKVVMRVGAM